MPRLAPEDLRLQIESASTVVVLVEGENAGEDRWVYATLFQHLVRDVTFLHHGGYRIISDAVPRLRLAHPDKPIYALVDRDVTQEPDLRGLEEQGVFRLPRYSLENYLLEPEGWHGVFQHAMRRHGGLPEGWRDSEEIATQIAEAYAVSCEATSFNRVVSKVTSTHPDYPDAPKYIRHPEDARVARTDDLLQSWAKLCGNVEDLPAERQRELIGLRKASTQELCCLVDGKLVLQRLLGAVLIRGSRNRS